MLTQQDTLMSSQPQISTLVFQEQSTLPLSDACSKSVSCQFDEIFNFATRYWVLSECRMYQKF